jgi:hypothetical protein
LERPGVVLVEKARGVSPGIRAIRLWVLPNIPQVREVVVRQCDEPVSSGMAELDVIEVP